MSELTATQAAIGQFLVPGMQRDAIHIAVAPMVCGEELRPGQWVMLDPKTRKLRKVDRVSRAIGIVDPFLPRTAPVGAIVFLFLMPNSIAGLRHHWEHREFPDTDPDVVKSGERDRAIRVLVSAADDAGYSYNEFVQALLEQSVTTGGENSSEALENNRPQIQAALNTLMGRDVEVQGYFGCAC